MLGLFRVKPLADNPCSVFTYNPPRPQTHPHLESDGDRLLLRAPGLEDLERERYCRGGLGRSVTDGRMRSFDAERERDGAGFGLGGGVFSLGGEGVGFLGGRTGGGVGDFLGGGGEYLGSGFGAGLVSIGSGFFSGVGFSGLTSDFFSTTFSDFFVSFAGACFTEDFVRAAMVKFVG